MRLRVRVTSGALASRTLGCRGGLAHDIHQEQKNHKLFM